MNTILSLLGGGDPQAREIQIGVYQINHFNFNHLLKRDSLEEYPEFSGWQCSYGVCDNLEQIFKEYPEIQSSIRKFCISLTQISKATQPSEGGWRWHKWGPYIGSQPSECEYLYNEPHIDSVFVYHIYEIKD